MAYVSVESDDRLEEGPEGLQFKSYLDPNAGSNANGSRSPGRSGSGYFEDTPRKSGGGFWTVDYYQQYFDVDTKTVLQRCYTTLLPTSSSYRTSHLSPAPDLYGPFWTLSTLIFCLFLSSSLAHSISSYLSHPDSAHYDYDFHLLSIAVSLVYAYGLGVPVLLWLALRYLGVGEWSMVEAVAIWGYGQFIWIPVSILCVIPVPILRWVLVGVAFGLSGYFLVANVYPILASAEQKAMRLIIIVIGALHAGLALTFKVLFFSYYVVGQIGSKDPLGDTPGAGDINEDAGGASNTTAALLKMLF
ncbi:Yip1-domain-containing protein [Punctularia strigosozonata HHB-11173 SS5]|uniref:Yip1-domain-containing protein n=1 Tax=Punctularia strigosozonata (strain HHB-11173) TaxID=741275 RepID=UPI000441762E|nr:Yip1-domain-containing protein [Punctularia strigosozonata HHB-11173 SS5]EIN14550.1 Yip1-domain-containing protein [Punctularia strigosozonata HHB-11173 SS5]